MVRLVLVSIGVVVLGVVVGVGWLDSTPAAAHDQLLDSSPTADGEVPQAPSEIVLRFGGQPLEMGATVIVADASGVDWAEGSPRVEGSEVIAALRPEMADGYYQVRWRIVSEDGAIVSGHFGFGVGDLSDAAPVALPSTVPADERSGARSGDFDLDQPEARTAAARADSGPEQRRPPTALVALGGALASLALVAVYLGITRPRRLDRDGVQLPTEEP